MSMSADGYIAGPDQSEENPLGVGGIMFTVGISGRPASTRSTSR